MGLRSDIDDVREQIHRDHLSLLATDVRVTVQKAKLLLADFLLEQKFNRMMRAVKANFNPAQPRVPAGDPDGGQWTDTSSDSWARLRAVFARDDGISDARVVSDANPARMTPSQAEALVKEIMESKEPRIRNFNRMVKFREMIHSYRKRFGFRGNE